MTWSRYPLLSIGLSRPFSSPFPSSFYMAGEYKVMPKYARGHGGRILKRIVWHLYKNNRMIGRPFHSARLAKAFAEAYAALGDDRRARAVMLRDGAQWCYDKEREWRRERMAA